MEGLAAGATHAIGRIRIHSGNDTIQAMVLLLLKERKMDVGLFWHRVRVFHNLCLSDGVACLLIATTPPACAARRRRG